MSRPIGSILAALVVFVFWVKLGFPVHVYGAIDGRAVFFMTLASAYLLSARD